ncbi:hypothetical protein SCARD494_00952 [Seiridium cardinale]
MRQPGRSSQSYYGFVSSHMTAEFTKFEVHSVPSSHHQWNIITLDDVLRRTARKLAVRLGTDFGHTFGSATQRCVDCNFNCEDPDLHDESFRQEFYSSVVALREENVKQAGLEY